MKLTRTSVRLEPTDCRTSRRKIGKLQDIEAIPYPRPYRRSPLMPLERVPIDPNTGTLLNTSLNAVTTPTTTRKAPINGAAMEIFSVKRLTPSEGSKPTTRYADVNPTTVAREKLR
jgi:hypothetical protein